MSTEFTTQEHADFIGKVRNMLASIGDMLIAKNKAYGNSALEPCRIFSQADAIEQIKVRIDDKLSRIKTGKGMSDESLRDTERDLIGYMILKWIAEDGK